MLYMVSKIDDRERVGGIDSGFVLGFGVLVQLRLRLSHLPLPLFPQCRVVLELLTAIMAPDEVRIVLLTITQELTVEGVVRIGLGCGRKNTQDIQFRKNIPNSVDITWGKAVFAKCLGASLAPDQTYEYDW